MARSCQPDSANALLLAALAMACLVVAMGCKTAQRDRGNNAGDGVTNADAQQTTDPPFDDKNIAGRRSDHLPSLTKEQFDRFLAGFFALEDGDPARAAALLEPLLGTHWRDEWRKTVRDDEWLLANLGDAWIGIDRHEDALVLLQRGLDRYPDNGLLHLNTAWALDYLGYTAEAIPHFQAYLASDLIDRDPVKTLQAMVALAANYREQGRIGDCRAVLEQCRQRFGDSPLLLELLAECASDIGDADAFRELANQAAASFDAALVARPGTPTGPDASDPDRLPGPTVSSGVHHLETAAHETLVRLAAMDPSLSAQGEYRLPVRGPVQLRRGPECEPAHWGIRHRFAVDLLPLDDAMQSRPDDVPLLGSDVTEWAAWSTDVLAARDGEVLEVETDHPDQPRTGVPDDDGHRPVNRILVRHADGEISVYECLQQGSALVTPGQSVTAGQPIARVGCSGTRPVVPHLGFRVVLDTPDGLRPGLRFAFVELERFDDAAGSWSPAPVVLPDPAAVIRSSAWPSRAH